MNERTPRDRERGFTLMEVLITLVLVAMVTLGVFRIFTTTNQTYRRGTENIDGQQNARAALSWLTKELRGAKGFTFIGPDEVTFLSDVNVPNQIRTFRLDTADDDGDGDTTELLLIRNPADDGTPIVVSDEIAVGIDSLAFIYRNGAGNVTAFRSSVQEVEVFVFTSGNQMREEEQAEVANQRTVAMSSRVRCRNLGKSVPTLGDVTPPAAPGGLAVAFGCGTATVTWSANAESDIAGYYLSYEQNSSGSPYEGVGADQGPSPIFVGDVTSYTLTGLDLTGTYYFNLQAVDQADNVSFYGSEVSGNATDAAPPTTPTNLSARVVGNDRIQLSWTASPEWDVSWYRVFWESDLEVGVVHVDSTTSTSLVLADLSENAVYTCRLTARDECGNESTPTAPVTITMVPCDDDVTFPDVPGTFDATAGDEFVRLTWSRVADPDVVGYQVYFVEQGGGSGYTLLVGNVDAYSVHGLENGTEYGFQVAALDGCGHVGGYTGLEEVVPFQCADNASPPGRPLNLTAHDLGLGDRVELSWTRGSEADVLGYKVLVGTTDGVWDAIYDVGDTIFHTVFGLTTGVEYWFSIVAYDVCGNESDPAVSKSAIPTWGCACPPLVSTTVPVDFAIVQGTTPWTVTASACSTGTVAKVEFEIDGAVRYVDYTVPFEFGDFGYGWTTSMEADGPHRLIATVVDDNGCEASDTTNVFVDNSGVGISCVGVPDGAGAAVEGVYAHELVVPVENFSAIDTYSLERMVLDWDLPGVYPYLIYLDDILVWSAGVWPEAAPGDTIPLMGSPSYPPGYAFEMRIWWWDYPSTSVPDLGLADGHYSVTFLGGPILECGPYDFVVETDCWPGVEITSVNSTNPYDVWGQPHIGDVYYTDRTYTLTYLPDELSQSTLIRTPNNDKTKGDSHSLVLTFDRDVTAYIAYDPRGNPPDWIRGSWTNTGLSIGVTDSGTATLGLWTKDLDAGAHTFSGNMAQGVGSGVGTNYIIFSVCR